MTVANVYHARQNAKMKEQDVKVCGGCNMGALAVSD
jgi:hypothetical protein